MTHADAEDIIRAMAASIRINPNQFRFRVEITGQTINAGSGTGMVINMSGGHNNTGNQVSMTGVDVKIAQERANSEAQQQMENLAKHLTTIADKLKSGSTNKAEYKSLYERICNDWVPNVISSIVGAALSKTIGL